MESRNHESSNRQMIRVLIVDDQTLVRRGIRSLLELAGDIEIVGEAGDGEEAVTAIEKLHPDVVLLDVRMPKLNGVDVLQKLNASNSLPPTILLTTFDDDEVLLSGVRAGARGYLLKDVSLEQLTDAIRTVASGDTMIRPAVTERVLKGLEHVRGEFDALVNPDPLTRRELEILRLMAGGYSNREIATALGTAEGTVKNHASSILSKLGVRDRTRAVLKALELGYI
jgi:DNA-binding NarL/FixJ family response regulator